MGKYLLVGAFLLTSAVALFVFLSRDDRSLREQVANQTTRPRIILEDFTIFRYHNHRVLATLSGKLANFVEPNILEIYGDLHGMRHDSERKEYVKAEGSSTTFRSRGVMQLLEDPYILKTELENDVQFGFEDNIIFTQYAEYLPPRSLLRSDLPVLLRSPQGYFRSMTGFEYHLEKETMEFYGPIQGTLQNSGRPSLP